MTDAMQTNPNAPERAQEKSRALTRDGAGRFAPGNGGGPGPRPKDPTLKALAIADRQRNFAFIQGLRDDAEADMELRFEAAKLLAQYSDGKPITVSGPAVQVNVGTGAGAITVGSSGHELYRAALAAGADVDEILHLFDQQRALESHHPEVIEGEITVPTPAAAPAPPQDQE